MRLGFIIYVPGIYWDDRVFLLLLIDNHFPWMCTWNNIFFNALEIILTCMGGHPNTFLLLIYVSTCLCCHTSPGPSIPWAGEEAHLCNYNAKDISWVLLRGREEVSIHGEKRPSGSHYLSPWSSAALLRGAGWGRTITVSGIFVFHSSLAGRLRVGGVRAGGGRAVIFCPPCNSPFLWLPGMAESQP